MDMKHPAYSQLNKFVGTWETAGRILATGQQGEQKITGTDSYEWLPGHFFLLHKADVLLGNEQSHTHEIIGFDSRAGHFTMQYYDNRGNTGSMMAIVKDGLWNFTGGELRFHGRFNNTENEFSGIWEKQNEEGNWEHFMDIKLTRKRT